MRQPFCKYCLDRGCLVCDRHSPARLKRKSQEIEALDFLQERGIAPVPDLVELIIDAIEHGAERHQRTAAATGPEPEPAGRRWERLEIG